MTNIIVILITVMPHRKGWNFLNEVPIWRVLRPRRYLMYAIVKTGEAI